MTTAIILAGGLGTRLRSVVQDVPKPMADIGGKPFLHYQLDYWRCQGVTDFILAVGYLHECVTDYFGDHYHGLPLRYSVEPAPLGTGGALLLAMEQLENDAPFLLLNGDTFFEVDLTALHDVHRKHGADWTFALFCAQEDDRYMGMSLDADDRIQSLKTGSAKRGVTACGGVYIVNPGSIDATRFEGQVSLEDHLLPQALAAGQKLQGAVFDSTFIDIGLPHDYDRAYKVIGPRVQLEDASSKATNADFIV